MEESKELEKSKDTEVSKDSEETKELKRLLKKQLKRRFLTSKSIISIIAAFLIVVVALVTWQTFKQRDTGHTTVYASVTSLEKVNEATFLNVGIQKVLTREETNGIIPFSEKKALVILNYKAKFGIKRHVDIEHINSHYTVKVPKFEVTGFEFNKKNGYQLYDIKKGILSFSTKDIDTGELVANNLSGEEQQEYLKQYKDLIKESAKSYYEQIISSIDKDAKVTVKFQD